MSSNTSRTQLSINKINESHEVLRVALISRILLISLIILWRSLLSPYDTSAILNPNCLSSDSYTSSKLLIWPKIGSAIEGSITYAFFPLLPIFIYILSRTVFAPLAPIIGYRALLGLSGYFINNVAFLLSAVYFYRLSAIILKDRKTAFRASMLFASIQLPYSIHQYIQRVCILCFLSVAMHLAYDAIVQKKRIGLAVKTLIDGALRSLCIFAPFVAFQAYGYHNLCRGLISHEMRPWCKARVPFLYDFLQGRYWWLLQFLSQGGWFLEEKNLAVILYPSGVKGRLNDARVSANFSSEVLKENPTLKQRKKMGKERTFSSSLDTVPSENDKVVPATSDYASISVLPFVLHLAFMSATAFFVMHVQVATCFLSSSPPLYWFSSYLMASCGRCAYVIWAYSAAYILLGSLLFSNFYPFT
ncbi:hypothetical protein MKW98_014706 [Papaver atlanticum]|uniref:GPI mannosyltransferase 2 n=1 Tax=Papaver atlanticum TaxID=357466 RepID=A0AAD4SGE6_9MAGN|nr:hypothetical protein MKW98_014706 [Papaver atlanticum]